MKLAGREYGIKLGGQSQDCLGAVLSSPSLMIRVAKLVKAHWMKSVDPRSASLSSGKQHGNSYPLTGKEPWLFCCRFKSRLGSLLKISSRKGVKKSSISRIDLTNNGLKQEKAT